MVSTEKNFFQGIACIFAGSTQLQERLHWILRISSALCFIGHGAWGVITKAGWLPFYNVFGIQPDFAYMTMPLVGSMDIVLGIILLFAPLRAIMLYMGIWAVFTALLRPMAGMGWWEFLERGGNYGAPLAMLYLSGLYPRVKDYFKVLPEPVLDRDSARTMAFHLRIYAAFLMIGHGGYCAFVHKKMLIDHFASVHLPPQGMMSDLQFITAVGWFELVLGVLIFLKPWRWLCLLIVFWKLSTEFLYVTHGPIVWDIFEFIERWGSYGVPLALYFLMDPKNVLPQAFEKNGREKFHVVFIFLAVIVTAAFIKTLL